MNESEYSGPVAAMRDSPWLASEDLEMPDGKGYRDAVVTIDTVLEVRDVQFKGGRKKAKGYALQFHGKERRLFLNGVNRETLKEMFGRRATDWIGKAITLYVKPDVMLAGKKVPGIRVKPAPKLKAARTENPDAEPPPEAEAFEAANPTGDLFNKGNATPE